MLVSDIINKIQSKELKIKELAVKMGVSDRTVQSKIKSLGYVWNSKEARYEYIGEEEEKNISSLNFDSLFNKKSSKNDNSLKKQSKSLTKFNNIPHDSNFDRKSYKKESTNKPLDRIDILLAGIDEKKDRIYRGFYFDQDILAIIDRADKGNKSNLVNEILRKVFKEKGLL